MPQETDPELDALTRLYRGGVDEQPPVELDASILNAAKESLTPWHRRPAIAAFGSAAVMFLALGLFLINPDRETPIGADLPFNAPAPSPLSPSRLTPTTPAPAEAAPDSLSAEQVPLENESSKDQAADRMQESLGRAETPETTQAETMEALLEKVSNPQEVSPRETLIQTLEFEPPLTSSSENELVPPPTTSAGLSGVATEVPKQGNEPKPLVSEVEPTDQVLEEVIVTAERRKSSVSRLSVSTLDADEKTLQRARVIADQQIEEIVVTGTQFAVDPSVCNGINPEQFDQPGANPLIVCRYTNRTEVHSQDCGEFYELNVDFTTTGAAIGVVMTDGDSSFTLRCELGAWLEEPLTDLP